MPVEQIEREQKYDEIKVRKVLRNEEFKQYEGRIVNIDG